MPFMDRKSIRELNRAIDEGLRYRRRRERRAPCIAVVDPDHFRRGTLVGSLQRAGYVALNAVDAAEVWRLLAREQIDLVALVVDPTDAPGLSSLAEVRKRRPGVPVVVLFSEDATAENIRSVAEELRAAEALPAPVGATRLLRSVAKLLEH